MEDAHQAGSESGWDCTLILTEGDSAKALAVAGLEVIGRERFGVFPLRGKPLNVRDATLKQVMANEEIKNLVQIMGLKFGQPYDENSIKTLRYGHLMIMVRFVHLSLRMHYTKFLTLSNFFRRLIKIRTEVISRGLSSTLCIVSLRHVVEK